MDAAVSGLERKLAGGKGTPEDWELLAKAYEFLGRPVDAKSARAHELPPDVGSRDAAGATAGLHAVSISGEVVLSEALRQRAPSGAALFIIARPLDSTGAPLAVIRQTPAEWPARFTLDDSQAMVPGQSLLASGRIRVEARLSLSGQPVPARGDLTSKSAVIDSHTAQVHLVIDRAIP